MQETPLQIATRIATIHNQILQIWGETDYTETTVVILCDESLIQTWEAILNFETIPESAFQGTVNIKMYKKKRGEKWTK